MLFRFIFCENENNTNNRQGGQHSQKGIRDNRTNTTGNYIYITPMPLQNESKHNDNWIKSDSPQAKIFKF
jgi:hypothetical protein